MFQWRVLAFPTLLTVTPYFATPFTSCKLHTPEDKSTVTMVFARNNMYLTIEGCVTRYHSSLAMVAEGGPLYALEDPRWLRR